jgi:glycosyltransferase involved in cell wall biosynthesis
MPVYNGEKYLPGAIECFLAQTFTEFELVISDNASTDRTPEIVRDYAAKDPRIRFHRAEVNRGAAWNFNRVYELSSGPYFKWAAHDDLCAPTFLEKCTRVLDQDRDVVLSYPRARVIDEAGDVVRPYDKVIDADGPRPDARFGALLWGHKCYQVFGLIRRSALERTPVMGDYAHADGVLLARLGLMGRLREIPEYLFFPRAHGQQSMTMVGDYHQYTEWFATGRTRRVVLPYWRMLGEFLRAAREGEVRVSQRTACLYHVGRWAWRCRRGFAVDVYKAARTMWRKRAVSGRPPAR